MPSNVVFHTIKKVVYPVFAPSIDLTGAKNLPLTGGYIIAANHVDWLDGFFVATAVSGERDVPVNFLTASNNYWWTTMTIPIATKQSGIVDAAVDQLRHGKIICNFPEGARNNSRKLLPGKTGTVRMAALANVPIIPVGITYPSHRTMAQSFVSIVSRREKAKLMIGQPLWFSMPGREFTNDWLREETERLMKAIAPLAGKQI